MTADASNRLSQVTVDDDEGWHAFPNRWRETPHEAAMVDLSDERATMTSRGRRA
ncbi:MAG: hypothetical protein Q8O56_04770 [Solirubrobacteraceae bacterium]|nr:hypothetical protein [Solirubrobacteraceae bacterium]